MADEAITYDDNIRFSCRFVTCNIAAVYLLHIPDWLSLVERLVWDQENVSSNLASGISRMEQLVAREIHALKVAGSNPAPAILTPWSNG